MIRPGTLWKTIGGFTLVSCMLLFPCPGSAESLEDGVILRDKAGAFLKDGTLVECRRIVWIVSAADFIQCDKKDHALEIKLEDLDFEKTFGPELAKEYAAMKGDLADAHERSRQEREASTISYESPMEQDLQQGGDNPADLTEMKVAGDDTVDDKQISLDEALESLSGGSAPEAFRAARAIAGQARSGADCSKAIAPLIEKLDDERPVMVTLHATGFSGGGATKQSVGLAVKAALVAIGRPAVPALIQRVEENAPSSSRAGDKKAIIALGEIRDERAVQVLAQHAQRREMSFRRDAVRAMAQIKGPAAWQGLLAVMRTQEGRVRLEAGWGLHQMDEARAGAAVDPHMDAMLSTPDSKEKRSAINLAGACGLKRLRPEFVRCLKHEDSVLVRMALGALAKVGAPAYALPRLLELAEEKRKNDAATRAIRTIKDPAALTGLIGGLHKDDTKVREACAWALGEIGRPEAVSGLAGALGHEDRNTRFAALYALGKIPGAEAAAALRSAANSEDPEFSMAARGQLKNRGYGN